MDELTIDGKIYVSSKRAAALSGYAKDYIGQLCREGRVESKLVGRSWYVYEPSIREHRFNDDRSKRKDEQESIVEKKGTETSEKTNIEAIWEQPSYSSEPIKILPTIDEEEPEKPVSDDSKDQRTLTEMQSTWQEWFSSNRKNEVNHASPKDPMPYIRTEEPEIAEKQEDIEEIVPMHVMREEYPKTTEKYETYSAKRVDIGAYRPTERIIEVPEPVSVKKREVARRKKPSSTTLVAKSALIALMVITISIASIAIGIVENIHVTVLDTSAIINFLQGTVHIIK